MDRLKSFLIAGMIFASTAIQASILTTPLKQEMELRSLQYFLDHAHPTTGLIRDFAENFGPTIYTNNVASIASTGFGLAVIANAAKRGLIPRHVAYAQAVKTLKFARDFVPRRKGWFLHWVNWETGSRAWNSEYSPIDTALFLAGALYAGQIFPNSEVQHIANQLYSDIDFFDYLTDGGTKPYKPTLSLSYKPETGYAPYQWSIYAEQKILILLGMGHPSRPLPKYVWEAWVRQSQQPQGCSWHLGHNMPLFIHQYSEVFIDFRNFKDGFMNYHHNGILASQCHRNVMEQRKTQGQTFAAGFWGFSAGASPNGYEVFTPYDNTTTICIGCTIASAMFMPSQVLADAEKWLQGPYASKIWGLYGFTDSVNLDQNWFSKRVIGITVGPEYMALANINANDSIWADFMKVPGIKRALSKATKLTRK